MAPHQLIGWFAFTLPFALSGSTGGHRIVQTGQLVLINAATGSALRTISTGPDFGWPVFADNMMLYKA
jgi:hypothetical protein